MLIYCAFKSLQNKRVLSLDLSALVAGSGIRGQFEEKFKALIRDIEEEVTSVCFFVPSTFVEPSKFREATSSVLLMKFVSTVLLFGCATLIPIRYSIQPRKGRRKH